MSALLREAWLTVEPGDYEKHMAGIGQAQANAGLMAAWLGTLSGSETVLVAGAGTGQMFDFLGAEEARPEAMVFSDWNPRFLEELRGRLEKTGRRPGETVVDNIEQTGLVGPYANVAITLVLEHVEWRLALQSLVTWGAERVLLVIQENPANLASAVTPGRTVPGTMNVFRERAAPHLIPLEELTMAMAGVGFRRERIEMAVVSDEKKMLGCWFVRVS